MELDSVDLCVEREEVYFSRGYNVQVLTQIQSHLKLAIKLTKWALAEADKVLPEYMFKSDV